MNTLEHPTLRRWTYFATMAALAVGMLGATALFEWHARAETLDRYFDTATDNVRGFEAQLTQTFNVIDMTLAGAADIDPVRGTAGAASKALGASMRLAPYLRSLSILDAHGTIVASSDGRNVGRTVAHADYLPPPGDAVPALRVGPPWIGRDFDAGRPSTPEQPAGARAPNFVPVAREVVLESGRRVTVLAAVNSDYFVNQYSQMLDSADGTVEMLRADGTLLLSTDTTARPGASDKADGALTRLAQSAFGHFEERDEDGRAVLTAYRASQAYPIVIVVHLDKQRALAGWRESATATVLAVVAGLAFTMALATWYYLRLERAARLRAEAEAAVRVSEAHHRNTFETAAVGIAHASPDGRLLRCNPHLCEMLGYSADELARKTISEITHPDDMAEDRVLKQRLFAGEIPFYRFEKRYLRRSAEAVWVRVTVSLAHDAEGRVEYMPAIVEDIHLRKLTHVALQALNTDLTGDAFLRQMTLTLTTLLGVEVAFIGETAAGTTRRFNTRAMCVDGHIVADLAVDLTGTPCETVTGNELRIFADQVQRQFPGATTLATLGIESYAAVPLGNSTAQGAPVGVLAIMSRHPLRHTEAIEALLPLLALRVGSELVREREAQKFRDLFDSSPGAVFLIDHHDVIRMSSRAGERMFGWEPQDVVGRKLAVLFPADHAAGCESLYRTFVESGSAGPVDSGLTDVWSARRDGSVFPAHVRLHVLETAEGRTTVLHVQDITERKRAEQELRERQVLLSMAGRVAHLGGWSLELPDRRLIWSDVVAEIHDEPVGFSPSLEQGIDYFVPEYQGIVRAAVERCIADGTPYDLEVEKISARGRRIWVRTMGEAERDAQGRIVRIQGAFQEITERKRDQDALRELNTELESRVRTRTAELNLAREHAEQANRAKSAFLAAMSHEIRTPMNGVVGMIDVLEQSNLRSAQAEIVKTIRESAHALLTIVDDVLDFSKIEAGQFQVDSEPMAVADVVEGACDTLDSLAGKQGVELTLYTDPAIPARVLGDAARLRQVLLNLAGNAIKFSSGGARAGRVSVRASLVESSLLQSVLELSVADNGIGMDQATLARLFAPFTQADDSTTRRFGGTGLGLSISQRLVDMMGGTIDVHSEPGRGSTFTVRLPLTSLPATAAPRDEAFGVAGLCCLVIGAPQGLADDLAVYLAHGGALVHRAPSRAAALQWFGACAPGLWIGVLADTDTWPDAALAELFAVCGSRPDLQARFVTIERGQRRRPRMRAVDVVSLDRDVMHRAAFVQAVALAAGRITARTLDGPPLGDDTLPAPLSIQDASALDRLILVAEDNEINQLVLQRQLAVLGYTAHIARNGREALECTCQRDYPLLITDLHMPEMDGYELAAAVRAAEAGRRRMPIVALTANALKSEARRCGEFGMDDYMTKPLQLANLKAMLRRWLPAASPEATASTTATVATSDRQVASAQPALPAPCVLPEPTEPPVSPGSSSAHPVAPATALDVSVLMAQVGDEPEVVGAFLREFRVGASKATGALRAACGSRQAAEVEAVAHKLKSSARSVGALALGELCEHIEAAGRDGRLDTVAQLWPRFETEMAAVDRFLGASHH
jgi:two-component system sensor histidine kinase/response regulator